jgi:glycosyltransferase involved in cell wall biosynthesis
MRIGVNALYLIPGSVGGTETYLRSLLGGLRDIDGRHEYFVFTNRETGKAVVPEAPNFHAIRQPIRAVVRPARILWEQFALPISAARLHLDVMFNPGFTAPLLAPCPQVTVFHDLQHKRHPEFFRWFDLPFWRFLLYGSAQVSRILIAISDATARDLHHFYGTPENRIRLTPLGVDEDFFRISAFRHPEPFLLCVSTLHPHKNLEALLRTFAEVRRVRPEFRLVVCGLHGFASGSLHALRDSLGLRDAVDFPGWIPRGELHDLFRRAWAFIYPSLFEGFGLPVLEAMAAGVPTACSGIEPLRSISADAALHFDPHQPESITSAILRLLDDDQLRAHLSCAGPERAAQFSWQRTAAQTIRALEEAAASR